jgi:hypothetical protein
MTKTKKNLMMTWSRGDVFRAARRAEEGFLERAGDWRGGAFRWV